MQKIGEWVYEDLPEVLSTNDSVLDLLEKVKKPCIVSAERQTKGRGRLGRTWQEAKGNLFVSFAYEIYEQNIGRYAVISALAVLNTVRYFVPFAELKIKWPNDVLAKGKKISGILFEKGPDSYWIMGIGINVASTPKVENPIYEITSLSDFGVKINRMEVLKKLVHEFDAVKALYIKDGFASVKRLWLDNAYQRDKKIMIRQNGRELTGILRNLDDNAGLMIETNKGIKTVLAGDVFFKG